MEKDDTLPLPRGNLLFQPGCTVFGCRIEKVISESCRSTVFLAEKDQEKFAVKVYHLPGKGPTSDSSALTGISNAHLLDVVRYGETDGHTVEISRYIDGVQPGTSTGIEIGALIRELYQAIQCLHAGGFLHNDITPDNILLTSDGGYKLIDFGSVCRIDAANSSHTGSHATFRAPEAYGGAVSTASDFWALGRSLSRITRNIAKQSFTAPQPDRIVQLIDGLTKKNPGERWSHPQVRAWLENKPIPECLGPAIWSDLICIGRIRASNPKELALAVSLQWNTAAAMLSSGSLAEELEQHHLTAALAVLKNNPIPDVSLFCLVSELGGGSVYKGRVLNSTSDLRAVAEEALNSGDVPACTGLLQCRELNGLIRDKALARSVREVTQRNNGLVQAYYLLGGKKIFVNKRSFESLEELLGFAESSSYQTEVYAAIWSSGMLPGFAASLGYKKQADAVSKLADIRMPELLPAEAMQVLLFTESCGLAKQSRAHAAAILGRLVPPDLTARLDRFSAIDFEGKSFLRDGTKTIQDLGSIAADACVSDQMNTATRALVLSQCLDRIDQAAATGAVGHIYPSARHAAIAERFNEKLAAYIAKTASDGSLGVLLSAISQIHSVPDDPEQLVSLLQLLKNIPLQNNTHITNITPASALRIFSEPVVTALPVPGKGRQAGSLDDLYPGRLYCLPESEYERWRAEDADVRERKLARTQARTRAWGSGAKIAGWVVAGILLGGVGLVVVVLMLALSAF